MSKTEFLEIFAPLMDYFNANLSKSALMLYFDELGRFSREELLRARREILQTRVYQSMPKIAEFLEILEGSIEDKARLALDQLTYAIGEHGPNKNVVFEDKTIMTVVENNGGWEKICNLEGKDWDNFRKFEFEKQYKTYVKTPHQAPEILLGWATKKNGRDGYQTQNDPVYFVGNGYKAPMALIAYEREKQKEAKAIQNKPVLGGLLSGINKAAV